MLIKWQRWMESVEDRFEQIVEVETEDGIEEDVINKRPFVITAAGVIPDDWNFWIGHCDFYLTSTVAQVIMAVPGVESFEVKSPYRFRLAIGLAFDSGKVKQDIQKSLGITKVKPNISEDIQTQIEQIKEPYWAMYISPDGKSDFTSSNNQEDIYEQLDIYEQSKQSVGGTVLTWQNFQTGV